MTTNENEDPFLSPPTSATSSDGARAKGSALVADLDHADFKSGVLHDRAYWIGVIPQCPVEHIDCSGINFPKVSENVTQDTAGKTLRIPSIGQIVRLTRSNVETMREKMPLMVVRFLEPHGLLDEKGNPKTKGQTTPNQNLQTHLVKRKDGSTMNLPSRRGHMVRIPSAAEVSEAREAKRHINVYVKKALDEPAARYMFAALCDDQNNPAAGASYPDVLEDTDLIWSEE